MKKIITATYTVTVEMEVDTERDAYKDYDTEEEMVEALIHDDWRRDSYPIKMGAVRVLDIDHDDLELETKRSII